MGDATDSPGFPKLEHASLELSNRLPACFRPTGLASSSGEEALHRRNTALAHPEQFDMIHFTAHGKAEAGNPLDSAVVLSKDPVTQAYKLYAREIVQVPLHARLVTISACKSAGSRTYRGEGAVGLAWAFLKAGARQVVAGLWNVSDEVSEALMARILRRHALRESVARGSLARGQAGIDQQPQKAVLLGSV